MGGRLSFRRPPYGRCRRRLHDVDSAVGTRHTANVGIVLRRKSFRLRTFFGRSQRWGLSSLPGRLGHLSPVPRRPSSVPQRWPAAPTARLQVPSAVRRPPRATIPLCGLNVRSVSAIGPSVLAHRHSAALGSLATQERVVGCSAGGVLSRSPMCRRSPCWMPDAWLHPDPRHGRLRTDVLGATLPASPSTVAEDASSAFGLGMPRPSSSEVPSMHHRQSPLVTLIEGVTVHEEDAQEREGWSKLAAAALDALSSLHPHHPQRPAFLEMWAECRQAAGLPRAPALQQTA